MNHYEESNRRTVREIREDMKQREANRSADEAAFVKAEGKRRMAEYLAELEASFGADAREEFREERPPFTFERLARIRLEGSAKQSGLNQMAIDSHFAALVKANEEMPDDE